ncbi:MAG: DUF6048 family protein [Cyclobacteriaceae bacterium]
MLILLSLTTYAQKPDSVRLGYAPTGLRIGTDLISLAKIPLSDKFDGWEVAADLDFNRYYLTVEFGNWERTLVSPAQEYSNSGNYYRIGPDVNFLLKDPDRNMFFVGLRYAHARFNENYNFATTDPIFGDFQQSLKNTDMKSGWGEITVGLRVKLWKQLWMGYTARLKVSPSIDTSGEILPYEIPGYGIATKKTYWGFNYQIYWRIPFRN